MSSKIITTSLLEELRSEVASTRKCLERIPEHLFGWKPHPKSMPLGYLSLLVAEIPLWIHFMLEKSEIDFSTFAHQQVTTNEALLKHFEDNIAAAGKSLESCSDEDLDTPFSLKNYGQTMVTTPKKESVVSTLNHWVHHRGQLTVYMRLNDIDVPSIYGPSADDNPYK